MSATTSTSFDAIRFRIWDTKRRQYTANGGIARGEDPEYSVPYLVLEAAEDLAAIPERTWKTRFVIEQWTGINDKTGRAIFEGDIVRVNGGLHLVERREGYWGLTWSDYHLGTVWFLGGEPEVVGNRWEHADLLKQATTR